MPTPNPPAPLDTLATAKLEALDQDEQARPSPSRQAQLFAALGEQIDQHERAPLRRARALSTRMRTAVAGLTLAVLVLATFTFARRANWTELPLWHRLWSTASLGMLTWLTVAAALRPLHKPAWSAWRHTMCVALSLAATLTVALFPPVLHPETATAVTAASQAQAWRSALPCFAVGAVAGLPVYLLLRLLDRGPTLTPVLAAATAALTTNLILHVHCPALDRWHNLYGHFTVALFYIGVVAWLEWRLWRRRGA
ncbi:MAG: hypothetical protein ACPGUV_01270 [Polyangiales bacterium]